jgi:hypothetical protein
MIGGWKYAAITLVLVAVLSGLGLGCAGLLSAPDPIVQSLAIALSVSLCGAIGLGVCGYLSLLHRVRTYLDRPPLSDEEFAAFLVSDVQIDLDVVREVRQLAATYFWSLGGGCFYPGDRLEADLHLYEVAPFALEEFWFELDCSFDAVEANSAQVEIVTFGDVVLETNRRRREKNSTA